MILELKDVHTYYGTSHVLFGVSLDVGRGEVVCLMGRTGAGKSTAYRTVMGLSRLLKAHVHVAHSQRRHEAFLGTCT